MPHRQEKVLESSFFKSCWLRQKGRGQRVPTHGPILSYRGVSFISQCDGLSSSASINQGILPKSSRFLTSVGRGAAWHGQLPHSRPSWEKHSAHTVSLTAGTRGCLLLVVPARHPHGDALPGPCRHTDKAEDPTLTP